MSYTNLDADLLGFAVSARGLEGDVAAAVAAMRGGETGRRVFCLNPHSAVTAADRPEVARALRGATLLLPDGAGVLLAARLIGLPIRERVAGMEFFLGLSRRLDAEGGARYFFLGASEPVLAEIAKRLGRDFPNIVFAGSYAPPYTPAFTAEENAAMIRAITDARPDVLWVGLTAPKQELWIAEHGARLNLPVAVAIGAAFDFYAGTKKRAPAWVRNLGLEWLPRLIREPRRLWRRNLVSAPRFLAMVLRGRRV